MHRGFPKSARFASLGAVALALAGCAQTETPAPTPVDVSVVRVEPGPVAVSDELPGRVVAYRVAEIRAQVSGIVQQRLFEQGAMVKAGQPLFQINRAPFLADADSAAATLQRAQATFARTQVQVQRLQPLIGSEAISRQTYDDAVVARDQAQADIAQARAALNRKRLDLGFARVTSPISGQIGAANLTEGALVSPSDTSALATVQQIDKVYIDVRQPSARFEALRAAAARGNAATSATVTILSTSGEPLPTPGRILFSDVTVDASTGNAVVRVLVDNPGQRLLPGMFVRARLPRIAIPRALTVPQQALGHDGAGGAQVNVVDDQGRVTSRAVTVGDVVDGRSIILSGLRPGETVVVEGQDRVLPGVPVRTVPWHAPRHQG